MKQLYTFGLDELTPVQKIGEVYFKRDDLFSICGVYGGKARSAWNFIQRAMAEGEVIGLCTAGHRESPQVNIASHIGSTLGLPVRCHTPLGKLSPELQEAQDFGAQIFQHKMGYGTVIRKRAKDDAEKMGYLLLPFGMEHKGILDEINYQMSNIPWGKIDRIVTISGSGMTAAGILGGMIKRELQDFPVLVVAVGANRVPMLNRFLPDWETCNVEIVQSKRQYNQKGSDVCYHGLMLDETYESKYIPYLRKGDCAYVVGIHRTQTDRKCPDEETK